MRIAFDSKEKTIVQFEKGDEPIALFAALAAERGFSFTFSMIGGCSETQLAFYDIETKKYVSRTHSASHIEITNVIGNVAWFDGKPWVHAHGVFGDHDQECFGGHINSINISATGECVIDWLPVQLKKEVDPTSGLKLFCGQK